MKRLLNIIARTNGVGLDRDVDLLQSLISDAGFQAKLSHCRSISRFSNWFRTKTRYDANIFIERIYPRWFGLARLNLLIPNQERFPNRHISRLEKIDHVLCKTQHALEIFSELHPSCHYLGFTSKDLYDNSITKSDVGFLHLAGRSTLKGTETILELWKAHPEWPTLTLLQHKENAPDEVPANVNLITDYLSDEEIVRLINEHPFHLCTSRSEGWGHYIAEAMSCGAVVITTDAPPMNELVTAERGLLVPFHRSEPRHLGTNFFVDPSELEKTIESALVMTGEERTRLSQAARQWFLENDKSFSRRFKEVLERIS